MPPANGARPLGRVIENELEVTSFEPGRRLTLEAVSGPILPFTVDHELFEQDGGGSTFLHVVAEGNPGSFMNLAKPMLKRQPWDDAPIPVQVTSASGALRETSPSDAE